MTGHPALNATQIMPLQGSKTLNLVLSLNLRNADQLKAYINELNDPGSANYHQYLTPAQFKAQYAPTAAQVQMVVAHLKKFGLQNITVSPNNALVSADATSMSASAAFNTTLKTFSYQGKPHFANDADVMVPQELGTIVGSVLGLQNVSKPYVLSHRATPAILAAAKPSEVGHQPTDFPKIYDAGNTPTGSKTVVGIFIWNDTAKTIKDLAAFTKQAGLPTVNTLTVQGQPGKLVDDGDDSEWALDSQDIVGISGGVKQLIFYAENSNSDEAILAAYNRAVTDNVAKVFNISFGEDETATHADGVENADDAIFAQAAAQGQTISVASGDAGVYQWSYDPIESAPGYVADTNGKISIDLSHYSVSEPAASPYVVAVGGTTLSTIGTTTWAGETAWNEGLSPIDPDGVNNGGVPDNNLRLWATGGGFSDFEKAPIWQIKALGHPERKRRLPDIAFDAAGGTGAIIIVNGKEQQYGGTSLASPLFVGVWARIESAHDNKLGLPTPSMYANFGKGIQPLHDVTKGNNGTDRHGYKAEKGFNHTNGWGSLDIAQFNAYVTKHW